MIVSEEVAAVQTDLLNVIYDSRPSNFPAQEVS